jgi:tryptophan-rich sensory protein
MSNDIIFKPRFSPIGWFFIILLPLIFLFLILSSINIYEKFSIDSILFVLLPFVFLLIAIFFLLIYPTMKYKLVNGKLILSCGPFKDIIGLEDIQKISKTNLRYHITSTGWKLPGYTLFKIYYADRGYIRMYATSMLKEILLIETVGQIYGITPKDEQKLIDMIKAKI